MSSRHCPCRKKKKRPGGRQGDDHKSESGGDGKGKKGGDGTEKKVN